MQHLFLEIFINLIFHKMLYFEEDFPSIYSGHLNRLSDPATGVIQNNTSEGIKKEVQWTSIFFAKRRKRDLNPRAA